MSTLVVKASKRRSPVIIGLLCWSLIIFDGYDLTVFSTVLSHLAPKGWPNTASASFQKYISEFPNDPSWHMTAAFAGTIASLVFVGMAFGALFAGRLADRFGRRKPILWCMVIFSVFTLGCAFAPNAAVMGICRFLAGAGLGGLLPTAQTLASEYVAPKYRALMATSIMTGIPLGGVVASLVGIVLVDHHHLSWQWMFGVAVIGFVVVLPLCYFLLPESESFVKVEKKKTHEKVIKPVLLDTGWRSLFRNGYGFPTVIFALAMIFTLFGWYGLGTWLPKLMTDSSQYGISSPHPINSLKFALALNLGAVIGSIIASVVSIKIKPLHVAVVGTLLAMCALGTMWLAAPSQILGVYLIFVLAGIGTHGTYCLLVSALAIFYPVSKRGTALGFALGFGRIGAIIAPQLGGLLVAAGVGLSGNMFVFGLAAAMCVVLLVACVFLRSPADQTELPPEVTEEPISLA